MINRFKKTIITSLVFVTLVFGARAEKNEGSNNQIGNNPKLKIKIEALKSPSVQKYIDRLAENKIKSRVVFPPPEYLQVISAGKPIVPYLIYGLDAENETIRCSSYLALIQITNKRFGNGKVFLSTTRADADQRKKYIFDWKNWWKKNKNKSEVRWLIDDVNGPDELCKREAIIELGRIGNKSAIPILEKVLNDPRVKPYAEEALERIKNKSKK